MNDESNMSKVEEVEPVQTMKTDKEWIEDGRYVPCAICERAFRRIRMTRRYCSNCERGFCEGEHGNFARGTGTCVVCGALKDERLGVRVTRPERNGAMWNG